MVLGNNERTMLRAMITEPQKVWNLEEILTSTGWGDQVFVAGAGKSLEEEGLVDIEEVHRNFVSLGQEGLKANQDGLLESRLWEWISLRDLEDRTMNALMTSKFDRSETGPGIGILKGLGVSIDSGNLIFSDSKAISKEISRRSEFINSLSEGPVDSSNLDDDLVAHFSSRSGLLEFENSVSRTWKLTKKGCSVEYSELSEVEMIGELTPKMLQNNSWKGAEFKPFDVSAPVPIPSGGRRHPMQSLIERIRSVFLEMAFSEIEGDYVQSAGWNMDALYIPQSHPARTMQDTFYLSDPEKEAVDEKY